jgi:hypothetical protein
MSRGVSFFDSLSNYLALKSIRLWWGPSGERIYRTRQGDPTGHPFTCLIHNHHDLREPEGTTPYSNPGGEAASILKDI